MADSEEKENNFQNDEIIKQSAKELEGVVVELYNNQNFSSAERLCIIILEMYEKIDSKDDVKRLKQVIQKLSLVEQYFEATFGLLKKQIESKKQQAEEDKQPKKK